MGSCHIMGSCHNTGTCHNTGPCHNTGTRHNTESCHTLASVTLSCQHPATRKHHHPLTCSHLSPRRTPQALHPNPPLINAVPPETSCAGHPKSPPSTHFYAPREEGGEARGVDGGILGLGCAGSATSLSAQHHFSQPAFHTWLCLLTVLDLSASPLSSSDSSATGKDFCGGEKVKSHLSSRGSALSPNLRFSSFCTVGSAEEAGLKFSLFWDLDLSL